MQSRQPRRSVPSWSARSLLAHAFTQRRAPSLDAAHDHAAALRSHRGQSQRQWLSNDGGRSDEPVITPATTRGPQSTMEDEDVSSCKARFRLARFIAATLVCVGAILVAAPTTAMAADGRAVSPEGELNALFRHGLGRGPDSGAWNLYMERTNATCREGVMRFSYDILISAEARNKWRTPENLVGSIYAALLDRAPDPGGFRTYVELTKARGFPLAVTHILASREYRDRLGRLCNGRAYSNATMLLGDASNNVATSFEGVFRTHLLACGINTVVNPFMPLKVAWYTKATLKFALGQLEPYKSNKGGCWSAYRTLQAMIYSVDLSDAGYAVFWETHIDNIGNDVFGRQTCRQWMRVGSDPSSGIRAYGAEFKCGFGAPSWW